MQSKLTSVLVTIIIWQSSLSLQAQQFTINSNKESGSCGNQHVTFEAGFIEVGTTYSFDSGHMPDDWSSSPYNLGQACSGIFSDTPDNSDYFWATINDKNGQRFVATNDLDVNIGGQITFSMRFGRDDPSSGCENPDEPSEGVYLQYSTDGGSQWHTIKYWVPYQIGTLSPEGIDLYSWTQFSVAIPEAAKTNSTRFRWFQPSNSGSSYDNWGMDDISVLVLKAAQSYRWDIGDGELYGEQALDARFDADGPKTVSCTVVDSEGDAYHSSISYEVILDEEAPEVKASDYFLILDENGQAELIADYLDGGSSDNCSELHYTVDKTYFSCEELGENTVTFTVSDNAGNTSSTAANVMIYDFTAPKVLTKDIKVQLDKEGKASVSAEQLDGGSIDACSDRLTLNLNKSEFGIEDLGENIVVLTATDRSGNQGSARATITIEDNTAPEGYTLTFDEGVINSAQQLDISFIINSAEVGSTYEYAIQSESEATTVSGSGAVEAEDHLVNAIDVSGLADGELTLSLTLTDASGNTGGIATATIYKDTTRPTVRISTTIKGPVKAAFAVNIYFSEAVSDFTLDDIALENATASDMQLISAKHYTLSIQPQTEGLLSLEIKDGLVIDAAENTNQASERLRLTYDSSSPEVTLSTSAKVFNTSFEVHVAFSEVVSGFAEEDISVKNGTVEQLQTEDQQHYIAQIVPEQDGEVEIEIISAVAQDEAGNKNLPSSESLKVIYDTVPPNTYAFDEPLEDVDMENVYTYGFKLLGLEVGSMLYYAINGQGEGKVVEGQLEVTEAQMEIDDLNLLTLPDGVLASSFYLEDAAGNRGEEVKASIRKTTVNIVSVASISSIEVPYATSFESIDLPEAVQVSCSDGSQKYLLVEWHIGNYNKDQAGSYFLQGEIVTEACTNTKNLTAQLQVLLSANLAPTQILISRNAFSPDISLKEPIAVFTTKDDDETHTYTLVEGEGDSENDLFSIIGDALFLNSNRGLSGKKTFSIRVQSADAYANATEAVFTLNKTSFEPAESINFINTFSPNGDGINEIWLVPDLKFFDDVLIEVYDRAGRRVFQTTDPEQGWDGSNQGSVQNGTYYYIITIKDIQLSKRGVLSVIK